MRRPSTLAVWCALLALAALPVGAASHEIKLLTGKLAPAAQWSASERQRIAEQGTALAAAGQERMHVLVQLESIPDPAAQEALRRDGIDLGAYVPDYAWVASVPARNAASVLARSEVRWATAWNATQKLHPRVVAGDFGSWTRDPSRPEWVMLFVQLHHDVDLARGAEIANAHGGVAMDPVLGLHGMTLWVPQSRVAELAREEQVLWIEEGPKPLSETNDGVRALMNADPIKTAPYNLDGTGVRLFVFDGGQVRATHNFFNPGSGSRVTITTADTISNHSTHVAATAAGDGDATRAEGLADAASILSTGYDQVGGTMLFWDNAGDLESEYTLARNTHNADLGTNSIGSNTASNDFPCVTEGDYGVTSALLDGIVRDDNASVNGAVTLTWANGNERGGGTVASGPGRCGANFSTTAEPSCAKNPIHVGALNSDGGSMTSFSSWGPCDDGRLKPIVSAAGCETGRVSGENAVFSATGTGDAATTLMCGTSMATPGVGGLVALFTQDWRAQGFGGANDRPLPALVKAMLIHTSKDLGNDGPDYRYGYGNVDGQALIDLLRDGEVLGAGPISGGSRWGTGQVNNAEIDNYSFTVPAGTGVLKASLAWDDAAAAAFTSDALVNDLDLQLIAPDTTVHSAFVLNPASPNAAATTGTNTLDNQEQVVVEDPAPGVWTVRVNGSTVPTAPQTYGLAYSATPEVSIAGGCSNSVTNTGFETDTTGWTLSGTASRQAAPAAGHGSFSLRFGTTNSSTGEAFTEIAIPADATRAEWTFFFHMTTDEGSDGFGFDNLITEVRSTAGTVLSVHDLRNDGWLEGAWAEARNIDLLQYAGQTVRLTFRETNDSTLPSTFWVDDVGLDVCLGLGDEIFDDGFETGDFSQWSLCSGSGCPP